MTGFGGLEVCDAAEMHSQLSWRKASNKVIRESIVETSVNHLEVPRSIVVLLYEVTKGAEAVRNLAASPQKADALRFTSPPLARATHTINGSDL